MLKQHTLGSLYPEKSKFASPNNTSHNFNIKYRFPLYTSLAWYFIPFGAIILLYCGIIYLARQSRIKKIETMSEATSSNPEQETLTSGTDTNEPGQIKK